MAKKEFKVGEVFHLGLMKIICVPAIEKDTFRGCFFEKKNCYSDITGFCDQNNREDKQRVIFFKLED